MHWQISHWIFGYTIINKCNTTSTLIFSHKSENIKKWRQHELEKKAWWKYYKDHLRGITCIPRKTGTEFCYKSHSLLTRQTLNEDMWCNVYCSLQFYLSWGHETPVRVNSSFPASPQWCQAFSRGQRYTHLGDRETKAIVLWNQPWNQNWNFVAFSLCLLVSGPSIC